MIALPIAATLISLVFGIHLLIRSGRRRAWFEGVWALAMLMFAAASGALVLGISDGWSPAEFRVYWLFGAVLNVPYLALGEAYLLIKQRWVSHLLLFLVLGATAWASAEIRTAPLNEEVLRTHDFFTGREVLGAEAPARVLAMLYSYAGTAVLILGILWSALGMRGRPDLRNRFYGVLLIALGALIVAGGAAFAAAANFAGFSVTLAAGVAVMYWGFLTATRQALSQPSR
jgi:MFS family permease